MEALVELKALANLINVSSDKIEVSCQSSGQKYPSPYTSFTLESEGIRMDPLVAEAGTTIVAAAAQLISTVCPPALTLTATALQFHVSSSLATVIQLNVAEILRFAGPKELHVKEIAAACNSDPNKLARLLRLLCTKHIFVEVAPDVFAHNRISSILDTGKSPEAIMAYPDGKHEGTTGTPALIEHMTDLGFKASTHLAEVMRDPTVSQSGEPNDSAFGHAFGNIAAFAWFDRPENRIKRERFGMGTSGAQAMIEPGAILEGFRWEDLPRGALVVDVAGGIGSQTLALVKRYDNLRFIVQDRPSVMKAARKFGEAEMPSALDSGNVQLQGQYGHLLLHGQVSNTDPHHKHIATQPITNAAVFFLRMILHDYSDGYCIKILQHLRNSANPETRLVIIDECISYACKDTAVASKTPGNCIPLPAEPLLANNGEASVFAHLQDLNMLTMLNGNERTDAQFSDIFERSGWKLSRVYHGAGFARLNSKFIGVPIKSA